ncbi:MAG: hypothetical protein DHS20C16_32380 [Phycisphaerae bacterium]|nr:MAG: hypothetical protein DHS20C16_32380 [Phycisphaerae bacterium]
MTVRTFRGAAVYSCAVFALVAGRSAKAGATLTVDDREIEVAASVTEGFNSSGIGPSSFFPPALGSSWNVGSDTGLVVSNPAGDAESSAIAVHNSSFDSAPMFSMVTASGTANAYGSVDAFATSADAQSNADSVFDIQFTITSPQDWSITAMTDDEGSGSTARVRLRPVGGSDIFILQGDGVMNGSDSGTLPPDDYQLIGEAKAVGFASTIGSSFFNKDAAFSFEFSIVPEPVSGMLVLVAAPLIVRRRIRK